MVVLGRSHRTRGAAGSGSRRPGPRRPAAHGQRSARAVHARAPPARRPPRRPAGERDPGRALGHRPRERLAPEHRALSAHVHADPPRARAGALRRAPPARADDAGDLHRDARDGADADRGDVPRLRRSRLDEVRQAALGIPHRPDRPPDRRVRARAALAAALASGRVRGDPERRARPGDRAHRRPRAPDRLRREAGAAEGAPGPPPRVARDPPPDGAAADGRGRRSARGPAAADPARRRRRGHRRRRLPEPGRAHRDAACGRRRWWRPRSGRRASAWC